MQHLRYKSGALTIKILLELSSLCLKAFSSTLASNFFYTNYFLYQCQEKTIVLTTQLWGILNAVQPQCIFPLIYLSLCLSHSLSVIPFSSGSHYVEGGSFKLGILLPQSPWYWNYISEPPYLVPSIIFMLTSSAFIEISLVYTVW